MATAAGKIVLRIVCLLVAWCGTTHDVHAQAVPGLDAIRVASGLTQPLFVTAPPGDFGRIFIVQQTGQVRILNLTTGIMNPMPFLDISARLTATNGEQGLLGLAFDPNYATNGKFYLNFTVPGGAFGNGTTHVSQFQVSANADVADISNEKILVTFDHPEANHNGGWIGFSPRAGDDHNLYIATGDGGASNDQDGGVGHIEPGGNAQNNTTPLGKMLRIHVDPTTGTYTIPANNPFFGSGTAKQEIWTLGLRNPFRDSFDRVTGRMLIGDVGQDTREEIDVQQTSNPGGGENYGWRDREGFIQNPAFATATPTPTPNPPRVDPIFDYPHTTGRTVIGGYIYRGPQFAALQGVYVFGDYLGPSGGSARVFTLNYDGTTASNFQDITAQLFPIPTTGGNVSLVNLSSLGEDAAGELYLTDIGNGNVYKLSPMLVSASSRKMHGTTPFEIDLPLTGTRGVECRSGGATGDYTMIFTFAVPLMSVSGRSVTTGVGSVSSSMIDSSDARRYIVNLTGVTNAQNITVGLTSIVDKAGNTSTSVSATMGVLIGDTTGNGFVNSTDISQTQSQSGQPLTSSNFREDVTVNGLINSTDVSLVQSLSGTALTQPPPSPTPVAPGERNRSRTSSAKAKSHAPERL